MNDLTNKKITKGIGIGEGGGDKAAIRHEHENHTASEMDYM